MTMQFWTAIGPRRRSTTILRKDVEVAIAAPKKGNSAGIDNIPVELVQAGGELIINVITETCNKIWRSGEWPLLWTQSLIITLSKKGSFKLCQNYRTISVISHSSKVILKVILNRLKPQAEEVIAEENAGFRGEVPQNRSSASESCVKSTSNTNKIQIFQESI